MERARTRSGASVDDIVRAIGALQPRGAASRRSWYDWQEKPETVSLLTGLAAMHMLGPDATAEIIFGPTDTGSGGEEDVPGDRMARIERRLEVLTEIVGRLQEATDVQRKILNDLVREEDPAKPDDAETIPSEANLR